MTCVWEPDPACLSEEWAEFTPEVQDRALMLATSSLQALTFYRVGTCPITIRPCPEKSCGCSTGFNPHVGTDGNWYNSCCQTVCKPTYEIDIPGPVGYIDRLIADGVEVDLHDGNWRLDNGHLLVWQGNPDDYPIPATQDLNLADDQPGTYSITYSRSYPVLEDARLAVAYLAAEFAKACTPKKKCSLPRGVTSVVRNGVSFTIQAGLFPNGLTNIDIVDQFILKWAPAGSPQNTAQVFDPRKTAPRRTNAVPSRDLGSV